MKNTTAIAGTLLSDDNSLREMLRVLVVDGSVGCIDDAIRSIVIHQAAKKEGVGVSQQELQHAVDTYRRSLELHRSADTHAYLERNSLTGDDLSRRVGGAIVRARLKRTRANGRVEAYFHENRHQFEIATISQIVVGEAGLAAELRKRLDVGSADFRRLAHEYSLDENTRWKGGFVGVVRRVDLIPAVASAIFESSDGDIVGPIETDIGHHLIAIEHIHVTELDGTIRAAIGNILFNDWLREEVEKAKTSGAAIAVSYTRFPSIEISDLDATDDQEVAVKSGIFQDSTSLIIVLSVTDKESTLTLHRALRSGASASVPELLGKLYEPLFDSLRGFECCGAPLGQCPHV